jgi:hypothetical protein
LARRNCGAGGGGEARVEGKEAEEIKEVKEVKEKEGRRVRVRRPGEEWKRMPEKR